MDKNKHPVTAAVRVLREKKIAFTPHLYAYEEHGGTRRAAAELGFDEHSIIKTLVFETDTCKPFLVLMHGDCEVSAANLARTLKVKRVASCKPETAQKLTGYMIGGISPFGTRTALPVCVEQTIFALPVIYINGGKRGFLVAISPNDLRAVLAVQEVRAAIPA